MGFLIVICITLCSIIITHVHCALLVAELQTSGNIDEFRSVLHRTASICADGAQLVTHHVFANSSLFRGFVVEHHGIGQPALHDLTARLRSDYPDFVRFWNMGASTLSGARNTSLADEWRVPLLHTQHDAKSAGGQASPLGPGASAIHTLTGVQELHNQGILGQGAVVAVIDVGLDYLHPAFGAFNDVASSFHYGVDLVGDDFVPGLPHHPDRDAYTECAIHGTHTSALIVGQHQSVGFVGVAPGASLEHYRAVGCEESKGIDDGVLIEALLLAHARQVDVISLSLTTGKGPFPSELVSEIIRRITQEDRTICVVSAGNMGYAGPFSSAAPATAAGAVSAGAVNSIQVVRSNPVAQAKYSIAGEEHTLMFEWQPSMPSRFPESLQLCLPSQDFPGSNHECSEDKAESGSPHSLDGCIVLMRRGGCSYQQKMDYIVSRGARYGLVYDNRTTDPWDIFLYDNRFRGIRGTGSLLATTGQDLTELLSIANVTLHMDSNFTLQPEVRTRENPLYLPGSLYTGGSWGPTGDLSIFPSILGPGGSVWSALPRTAGGYGTYTGTSISAPYIAGCAVLLRSVHPSWPATDIIRALIHTATPLNFNDGNRSYGDLLAPVWQQGGGLVNVSAASKSQTKVSTNFLAFNDTEFYRDQTFTITNHGDESTLYELHSVPAATVQTLDSHHRIIGFAESRNSDRASKEFLGSLPRTKGFLLRVKPSSLVLSSGDSAVIRARVDLASIQDEQNCPLYSGYIRINTSYGSVLSLPYGGIGCRMSDVPSLPTDWNSTFLTSAKYNESSTNAANAKLQPALPHTTFRLRGAWSQTSDFSRTETYPAIHVQLSVPSPHVEAFLVDCAELSTGAHSSLIDMNEAQVSGGFSRVVPQALLWTGRLANGSLAISGSYYLRVCAHRIMGSSFDCISTVPFNLLYI